MALALFYGLTASTTLGQAFTYQGRLDNNGSPVNGTFDIRCRLYDAASGGLVVAPEVSQGNVSAADGVFTVSLNFGSAAWNNADRWLEIDVRRPAGSGVWTTLAPRQPISRTPYAIQTRGIFVDGSLHAGIGTNSPNAWLHVSRPTGDTTDLLRVSTSTGSPLFVTTNLTLGSSSLQVSSSFGTPPLLINDGVAGNVLLANGGGRIGVGTTNPTARCHVISPYTETPAIHGYNSAADDAGSIGVLGETNSSSLGTGVRGEGFFGVVGSGTRGVTGFGDQEGVSGWGQGFDFLAIGPGTDYGTLSSIRWKRNIVEIGEPLAMLGRLRGVSFDWDEAHGGGHAVGMIAEEVGAVLPEIVQYDTNGVDAIGMDYSKLTPLLVEGVKDLHRTTIQEIAALRAENDALQARLASLESMVAEIAGRTTADMR